MIVSSTDLLVPTPTPVSKSIDDTIVKSMFVATKCSVPPHTGDQQIMRYYGMQEQSMDTNMAQQGPLFMTP
jgi:hypothetical protein